MPAPFEFSLALRYLRPKRSFVSVVTLISIIGVTLGVAVLIIVIAVMSGFSEELRGKILQVSPHVRVTPANLPGFPPVGPLTEKIDAIAAYPEVQGVAPYVQGYALAESGAGTDLGDVLPISVLGLDTEYEELSGPLADNMWAGEFDLIGDSVVLGSYLARRLGVGIGDYISVHSPQDLRKMANAQENEETIALAPEELDVMGIFDMGYYDFDSTTAAISLWNAQDLFGLGDRVDGLWISLKDPYDATTFARRLFDDQVLEPNHNVSTWLSEGGPLLDALMVEKAVMFYILFFIMLVAAFGIMGTLIAFVVQKTREIGILKALGATGRQIMAVFLGQSALIGLIGVGAGFGMGMLAVRFRNEFLDLMNQLTGFELFPQELYQFSELPARLISSDVVLICGGAILMCLLAGVAPAWNASRMKPLEALRHE